VKQIIAQPSLLPFVTVSQIATWPVSKECKQSTDAGCELSAIAARCAENWRLVACATKPGSRVQPALLTKPLPQRDNNLTELLQATIRVQLKASCDSKHHILTPHQHAQHARRMYPHAAPSPCRPLALPNPRTRFDISSICGVARWSGNCFLLRL
jgi:hypothetical protein